MVNSNPQKHIVLESLVDFLDQELDTEFDKRPKGTPKSIKTPRDLIEAEELPNSKTVGGSLPKYIAVDGESDDVYQGDHIAVTPAQRILVNLLVASFIVFVFFGFFNPSTLLVTMRTLFKWVVTSLRIATPFVLRIVENFSRLAYNSIKIIFTKLSLLKWTGFIGTLGLAYKVQWGTVVDRVHSQVSSLKTRIISAFKNVMASLREITIDPIVEYVIKPVIHLGSDIQKETALMGEMFVNGFGVLINRKASVHAGGMIVAGGYPRTRIKHQKPFKDDEKHTETRQKHVARVRQ
jgi:hypothetical protein